MIVVRLRSEVVVKAAQLRLLLLPVLRVVPLTWRMPWLLLYKRGKRKLAGAVSYGHKVFMLKMHLILIFHR